VLVTDVSTERLARVHREELITGSAIDPTVVAERGYTTVDRPAKNNGGAQTIPGVPFGGEEDGTRGILRRLGFPSWAIREVYYYPGLWIPQYTPAGTRYAGQWKPARAVRNREGKLLRYASAKGAARLDVHPRWTADRGTTDAARLPAIQDPAEPLWITEGVKKADALTSRGCVTVALTGVYNWRNTHASLGDWEDVRLRGREVWVCFDSDAITKGHVAKAMERLGKWLRYKGAAKVWYLVVPPAVNGAAVKGVDDYFAAGGTLGELERAAKDKAPKVADTSDAFTDAALAETMATEVLDGQYAWTAGIGWLGWDGRVWREVSEVTVTESARLWAKDRFAEAAARVRDDGDGMGEVDAWRPLLSSSRLRAVLGLAKGIVELRAEQLDNDPELLNTPAGVVNLATGDLLPHDPDLLITKITSGNYRPGFTHPDWDRALTVLPADVMDWMQARVGQGITGYTTTDGVVLVLQGGGENGKGVLTTDGLLPALGSYASVASPKLFLGSKNEHSTEMADLRGMRLVLAEELTEGRSIDVGALKRVADVASIRARRTHKDNMQFVTSHTIMATSNYIPVINETDHGTWRRLALVVFPYTYRKPGEQLLGPDERRGDPTLKERIKANETGQHDAAVTWAVAGAVRWFTSQTSIGAALAGREDDIAASVLYPPARVLADTRGWRREADRILGYWSDCLMADADAMVATADVLDHFNEWIKANGHSPWSKELFHSRFTSHEETKGHRVERRRTRNAAAIVRRPVASGWASDQLRTLPAQPEVYVGVRFALVAESAHTL
jgi:putative DNA primase/helicase